MLFAVMRETFWATGEDLLRRLVCSLCTTLGRDVVLAECVTTSSQQGPSVALWMAEGSVPAFRYEVVPFAAGMRDDAALASVASSALGKANALFRGFPVRSPSGRRLGRLILAPKTLPGPNADQPLLEAALLSPLAARAGAELARLQPNLPGGAATGRLIHICAWCKDVRDSRHSWRSVEQFLRTLTDAAFSHGICPECAPRVKT